MHLIQGNCPRCNAVAAFSRVGFGVESLLDHPSLFFRDPSTVHKRAPTRRAHVAVTTSPGGRRPCHVFLQIRHRFGGSTASDGNGSTG